MLLLGLSIYVIVETAKQWLNPLRLSKDYTLNENLKYRIAMLFWEWRKDKRLHGVLSDYTETSEDLFMKAYKILKG